MLSYSVTTNFRLELIEPSARGVSIFYFGRGETSKERRREHGKNLVRLKQIKKKACNCFIPLKINMIFIFFKRQKV